MACTAHSGFLKKSITCFLAILFLITALPVDDADAARRKKTKRSYYTPPFSALVIDAESGKTLYEKNADAIRYPASLTKMMTLYMTFEALRKGTLKMEQKNI